MDQSLQKTVIPRGVHVHGISSEELFINLIETQTELKDRGLSTTEAKIRNYWKSCDHRFPLFPAADPDPRAHSETLGSFFWGWWEQRPSDAIPQIPSCCWTRMEGWLPGRGVNSLRAKILEAGFPGCRNSCELLHIFFKPYMEPNGKVGSAVISAQVFLEEPCKSGISLKTPH